MNRAFTLVEIMVVITIIVVLLAMLAPAMDRAIYQAELTVCGGNLHGTGAAVLGYAMNYRRHYPYLPVAALSTKFAYVISEKANPDSRPMLRDHVGISLNGALNCPLRKEVDLEGSLPITFVYSGYPLWTAFRYKNVAGARGMYKLGDRFTYPVTRNAFSLLASDLNQTDLTNSWSSHPDDLGIGVNAIKQDQDSRGLDLNVVDSFTYSLWAWTSTRGLTDMNYLYDDGSVQRHLGVKMVNDPRMTQIPTNAGGSGWVSNLPTEN